MALHRLSLRAMLDGLRARKITPEELTRDLLARTAALEPRIRAWTWLDGRRALDAARAAAQGPLGGIGLGIKDIMHARGLPTGMGSPLFAGTPPEEKSATALRRLEAAGAFAFGKTVTAEFAYFHPGPTRNPWHPAHTPGGSSMGSAAAVAAGMVPVALGTQTNGSVIRPAAFCGCVGYKPSQGLVPRDGMLEFSATLDQIGVFARTVPDAALVASVIADRPLPVELPAGRPRFAAVRSPVWHLAGEPQRAQFARDIRALREAGAEVAEVELDAVFERAHAMQRRIMYAEGARALGGWQARQRDKLSAALNRLIDEGRRIAAAEYREALTYRAALQHELGCFLEPYDAIITPPACGEAPATLENTGDPAFCTIWTLAGAPAVTIPTGFGPGGLPLGLQVVGRALDDARLLGAAQWCAAAIGFDIGFPDDRA